MKSGEYVPRSVVVFGDSMIDEYFFLTYIKESPEQRGCPVASPGYRQTFAGGAANVASCLQRLGLPTLLVGDYAAPRNPTLVNLLWEHECLFAPINEDGPRLIIPLKCRYVLSHSALGSYDGRVLLRVDDESTILAGQKGSNTDLAVRGLGTVSNLSWVVLSDYAKGAFHLVDPSRIVEYCREAGIFTIMDPKPGGAPIPEGLTWLKLNLKEALFYLRRTGSDFAETKADMRDIVCRLVQLLKVDNVVVTMGEFGAIAYLKGRGQYVFRPRGALLGLKTCDCSGAGDVFLASFVQSLHERTTNPIRALQWALAHATLSTQFFNPGHLEEISEQFVTENTYVQPL